MIKNLKAGLFEQGKIKIGGKGEEKTSGKGTKYREAVKFDYFLVTTLERDKNDNFCVDKAAMQKLPEKPTSLPVELLYDDIELNFPNAFVMFNQTGVFCKGDGETAVREGKEIVCNIDKCPYFKKKSCKISGILTCRLPHVNNLMGVYKFRTHSWNSVKNVIASLQYIQTLTGGVVAGLPLELRLERKPSKHGIIKCVNLAFAGTQEDLISELEKELSRRQRLKIDIHTVEAAALTSGVTQDTDNPEDVIEEFYPATQGTETQEQIDAEIGELHAKIKALWDKYDINDFDRHNSMKKHLNVETLEDCYNVEALKEYGRTHQEKYKQREADKQEVDDSAQDNFDMVLQHLGRKQADALKKALTTGDEEKYNAILEEAYRAKQDSESDHKGIEPENYDSTAHHV